MHNNNNNRHNENMLKLHVLNMKGVGLTPTLELEVNSFIHCSCSITMVHLGTVVNGLVHCSFPSYVMYCLWCWAIV